MKVLDPGHRYELDNLKSETKTILQFMKDASLHGGDGADGPSCQEVLRAVIDRVITLDIERFDSENAEIIFHGRMMIAGFEARALRRRVEKERLAIESLPDSMDGHLLLASDVREIDEGTPNGWMYEHLDRESGGTEIWPERHEYGDGWTETPLYARRNKDRSPKGEDA